MIRNDIDLAVRHAAENNHLDTGSFYLNMGLIFMPLLLHCCKWHQEEVIYVSSSFWCWKRVPIFMLEVITLHNLAAENGNVNILEFLIEYVTEKEGLMNALQMIHVHDDTLLLSTAQYGRLGVLKFLLEYVLKTESSYKGLADDSRRG